MNKTATVAFGESPARLASTMDAFTVPGAWAQVSGEVTLMVDTACARHHAACLMAALHCSIQGGCRSTRPALRLMFMCHRAIVPVHAFLHADDV